MSEKGPDRYPQSREAEAELPGEVKQSLTSSGRALELIREDAVMWLRGAIGTRTGREAADILDVELSIRYHEYGRYEWDPLIAKCVRRHLQLLGFLPPQ